MKKKILITSALPYANGQLHFGHIAGAYLPADCYARFQRLQGHEVLYICGSDEYGVAITLSAEMAGRSPKEHVDIFHHLNQQFFHQLHFSFDHFSRTTNQQHQETVQNFFKDLWKNGFIEEQTTEQLFSLKENRFLADRYVKGTCPSCGFLEARGDECQRCAASYEATDLKNPVSKITGSPLILKPTKHWFLRFDRFKKQLQDFLESKDWKPNVKNFAKTYIEHLKPRAITRDSNWGIPVPLPDTEGKVLYVWFDAPIGYITATQEWAQLRKEAEKWKDFWLDPNTEYVQFIGKDNIPFHAVFFPAMILGQNQAYKLVDQLCANEFLNLEGKQFSKSDGWTIDLEDFFKHFTADQIRYTLAANAPETQDSEFLWQDFKLRCNSELLGKYGNLANRILMFIQQHCQGIYPPQGLFGQLEHQFLERLQVLIEQIQQAYQSFHLRKASILIMEIAQTCNIYFDNRKPWVLVKSLETIPQMHAVLFCSLYGLKILALASSPIIPQTAQTLWEMLGNSSILSQMNWKEVIVEKKGTNQKLPAPKILFYRIEQELIEEQEQKLKSLLK